MQLFIFPSGRCSCLLSSCGCQPASLREAEDEAEADVSRRELPRWTQHLPGSSEPDGSPALTASDSLSPRWGTSHRMCVSVGDDGYTAQGPFNVKWREQTGGSELTREWISKLAASSEASIHYLLSSLWHAHPLFYLLLLGSRTKESAPAMSRECKAPNGYSQCEKPIFDTQTHFLWVLEQV